MKYFIFYSKLIHEANPQSLFLHVLSVRPFVQNLTKQTKFQARIVITTDGTACLAEWIIDDTHVLYLLFPN